MKHSICFDGGDDRVNFISEGGGGLVNMPMVTIYSEVLFSIMKFLANPVVILIILFEVLSSQKRQIGRRVARFG